MKPFIDAHTHRQGNDLEVVSIKSLDIRKEVQDATPFCLGIHPWWCHQVSLRDSIISMKQAIESETCIAFGEMGLDRACDVNFIKQVESLEKQLELAKDYPKLAIVFHCVKAHNDLASILKKYKIQNPLVLHDYNGNELQTRYWLDHFCCFFSYGDKLYGEKSSGLRSLREIPLERILLETDDSERSIADNYQKLAAILNLEVSDLREKLYMNAVNTFGVKLEHFI